MDRVTWVRGEIENDREYVYEWCLQPHCSNTPRQDARRGVHSSNKAVHRENLVEEGHGYST